MAEATSDALEAEVLQLLTVLDVGKLEEVCGILEIDIPEAKQGNKSLILKLIVRFLHSEDLKGQEDHGHSTFLKLHTVLKGSIDGKKIFGVKAESFGEEVLLVNQDSAIDSEPRSYMKVHRLREFKIIGSIDHKDNLLYTSLSFQMEKGKKAGYSFGDGTWE